VEGPELEICSSKTKDANDAARIEIVKPKPFEAEKEAAGPASYSTSILQPLRGVPIREGGLWFLSVENDCVREASMVTLSLYVNGLSFVHKEEEYSFSLSPFTLVRNCRFFDSNGDIELSKFKCFKVSLFTHGVCLYWATGLGEGGEAAAEEERLRWALDLSCAAQLVAQSLLPASVCSCDPAKAIAETYRRLLAGYLLVGVTPHSVAALFCELQPQSSGRARLALYTTEGCEVLAMELFITDSSMVLEKVGINCSCFSLEDILFCARCPEERRLWLRVIANLKAKLRHRAPSPTQEELEQYRAAIKEHLASSAPAMDAVMRPSPQEPLLQRCIVGAGHNRSLPMKTLAPTQNSKDL